MKSNAYTIYDNKVLSYSPPFYAPTDGAALRIVSDVANDLNTSVGRHPTDYIVYRCGVWDDQLGLFLPETPLVHVIDVNALVNRQEPLPLMEKTA